MKRTSTTFTAKGQLVIPAELRRKHGIKAGTRVRFLEDQFGRIILAPLTEEYVGRVLGCLEGHDLVASWEKEHREEGERKG